MLQILRGTGQNRHLQMLYILELLYLLHFALCNSCECGLLNIRAAGTEQASGYSICINR